MKFHEAHRLEIHAYIVKAGLSVDQFFFRKKKGRIIIEHSDTKAWFSYFRMSDFTFNPGNMKIADQGTWEVKTESNKLMEVDSWKKILGHFQSWLRLIIQEK